METLKDECKFRNPVKGIPGKGNCNCQNLKACLVNLTPRMAGLEP